MEEQPAENHEMKGTNRAEKEFQMWSKAFFSLSFEGKISRKILWNAKANPVQCALNDETKGLLGATNLPKHGRH